ncbi:hypothetical protein ACKKBG_A06595 [Auxenochlorella protothecoides x Auxenochlorella symbiontica]
MSLPDPLPAAFASMLQPGRRQLRVMLARAAAATNGSGANHNPLTGLSAWWRQVTNTRGKSASDGVRGLATRLQARAKSIKWSMPVDVKASIPQSPSTGGRPATPCLSSSGHHDSGLGAAPPSRPASSSLPGSGPWDDDNLEGTAPKRHLYAGTRVGASAGCAAREESGTSRAPAEA